MNNKQKSKPDHSDYRQILKEKFLSDEGRSMSDDKLLELLLIYTTIGKDVGSEATTLIKEYGGLSELINASQDKLFNSKMTLSQVTLFKLIYTIAVKMGLKDIKEVDNIVLRDMESLADYCRRCAGAKTVEEFHVIFLNSSLQIINDEIMQSGTVDEVAVYPREVVKKALGYKASGIILYHNHPGGKATPSRNDIHLTLEIMMALESVNISLEDHLIITKEDMYSFKQNGLLLLLEKQAEKFCNSFLKP